MSSKILFPWRCLVFILVAMAGCLQAYAQSQEIRVVSSGGFAQAYKLMRGEFEKSSGYVLNSQWGPSMGVTPNAIPVRLERGEDIDVVIMVGGSLDELIEKGQLVASSKAVLAYSPIACAVKQGEKRYDISTVEKFREALLEVKSIAYSDSASGEYIKNELMEKLGIAQQMKHKARQIPATPVGEIVAQGQAELGCQQRSELMPVKGIDILGLIPESVQLITPFSAAIVTKSQHPKEARALIDFLRSPQRADLIEQTGLQAVARMK